MSATWISGDIQLTAEQLTPAVIIRWSGFTFSSRLGHVQRLKDPVHNFTIMAAAAQNEACDGRDFTSGERGDSGGEGRWLRQRTSDDSGFFF